MESVGRNLITPVAFPQDHIAVGLRNVDRSYMNNNGLNSLLLAERAATAEQANFLNLKILCIINYN